MAMKFWFGKKETERNEKSDVSGGVPSATLSSSAEGGATPSLFTVPQKEVAVPAAPQPVSVRTENGVAGGNEEPVAEEPQSPPESAEKGLPPPAEAALAGDGTPPASAVQEDSKPKAEAAKKLFRPVGAPLRLVNVPSAAGNGMSGGGGAPAPAATQRPVFAFRPKPGTADASAPSAPMPPAASAQPSAAAAAPVAPPPAAKSEATEPDNKSAMVRPKGDQRALYYELMNGLYDAVLILDDQGHVVDSNVRVKSVLGYTREETWDLPIGKVIPGMTSQMFEHLKRNLTENNHVLMDARCVRQDESVFASEVGVSTLTLTRGTNLVFAIRNVERRRNAMEELRKSSTALQIALAPAFVCDTEGFFQTVNQALLDTFGMHDDAQAKSVRFVDLVPDAARYFLRASCGEKLKEALQIQTPDGLSIKIELSLSPIQSGEKITAVAGSLLQV